MSKVVVISTSLRPGSNSHLLAEQFADSWMQHLAIHTQEQPGASNEWLEPVSDTQYNKLTAF